MVTLLHASDLQVGRPYRPHVAHAFTSLARRLRPDVVVVSGDLTQRAKTREYRAALELLRALPDVPRVVTPGNHDVPLYRFWERLATPFRNWRAAFGPSLDTVTHLEGATLVALSSAAPRRAIVGGRITSAQVSVAREAFERAGPRAARVLVVHHHFVPTPDGLGGRPLPRAVHLLSEFEAMGVDLVLGGHVHQTHVTTSRALVSGDGPGIPLVACGTTTSSRGRGAERGANTLNVVRVGPDAVEVVPHRYSEADGTFVPTEPRSLRRPGPTSAAAGGAPGVPGGAA